MEGGKVRDLGAGGVLRRPTCLRWAGWWGLALAMMLWEGPSQHHAGEGGAEVSSCLLDGEGRWISMPSALPRSHVGFASSPA